MHTDAVNASKLSKYTAGVPVVLMGWKWNCRSGAPAVPEKNFDEKKIVHRFINSQKISQEFVLQFKSCPKKNVQPNFSPSFQFGSSGRRRRPVRLPWTRDPSVAIRIPPRSAMPLGLRQHPAMRHRHVRHKIPGHPLGSSMLQRAHETLASKIHLW